MRFKKPVVIPLSTFKRLVEVMFVWPTKDISKMEAGKVDWNFSKCNARQILDQAIHATNGLFVSKPSVTLVQEVANDLPAVVADSDRIVQVIINLISNAVKFIWDPKPKSNTNLSQFPSSTSQEAFA